jgi:hypothetical protein
MPARAARIKRAARATIISKAMAPRHDYGDEDEDVRSAAVATTCPRRGANSNVIDVATKWHGGDGGLHGDNASIAQ